MQNEEKKSDLVTGNRETISSKRESESCSRDQSSGKCVRESKIQNLRQGDVIQLQGNGSLCQGDENMRQRKEIELQGIPKRIKKKVTQKQGIERQCHVDEILRDRVKINLQGNARRSLEDGNLRQREVFR